MASIAAVPPAAVWPPAVATVSVVGTRNKLTLVNGSAIKASPCLERAPLERGGLGIPRHSYSKRDSQNQDAEESVERRHCGNR